MGMMLSMMGMTDMMGRIGMLMMGMMMGMMLVMRGSGGKWKDRRRKERRRACIPTIPKITS